MSTVLDRDALEGSPLADLHVIAGQLGVDGYRRLRKADLSTRSSPSSRRRAAVATADAREDGADRRGRDPSPRAAAAPARARPRRRPRPSRPPTRPTRRSPRSPAHALARRPRARQGRRCGRRRLRLRAGSDQPAVRRDHRGRHRAAGQRLRLRPARTIRTTSDDDVYVSAAQVKRCELVSGDKVGGPVRPPRRSERFPSLVRVETINGRPADEVAGRAPASTTCKATFPTERLELGAEDPTVDGRRVADAVRQGLARRRRAARRWPARATCCAASPARWRAARASS